MITMKTKKLKRGYEVAALSVNIKIELMDKIENECFETGLSRRALVERILKDHYEENKKVDLL